jgi:hypothetical protein
MSTKIYHGFRIKNNSKTLNAAVQSSRELLQKGFIKLWDDYRSGKCREAFDLSQKKQELVNSFVTDLDKFHEQLREANRHPEVIALEKQIAKLNALPWKGLSEEGSPAEYKASSAFDFMHYFNSKYRSQVGSHQRDIMDFDVFLHTCFQGKYLYSWLSVGDGAKLWLDISISDIEKNLLSVEGVEEYCYWNNTDEPKDILHEEWEKRGKVWSKLLTKKPWVSIDILSLQSADDVLNIPMKLIMEAAKKDS